MAAVGKRGRLIDLGRMPGLKDRTIGSVVGNDDFIRKEAKERTGRKVLNPFSDHESLSWTGLDDFWDVDTLKRMDKVSHYFYSSHLLEKARERKS